MKHTKSQGLKFPRTQTDATQSVGKAPMMCMRGAGTVKPDMVCAGHMLPSVRVSDDRRLGKAPVADARLLSTSERDTLIRMFEDPSEEGTARSVKAFPQRENHAHSDGHFELVQSSTPLPTNVITYVPDLDYDCLQHIFAALVGSVAALWSASQVCVAWSHAIKSLLRKRKARREELILQLFQLTAQKPFTAVSLSFFSPRLWTSLRAKLQAMDDAFYEDEIFGIGPFRPNDFHILSLLIGDTKAARLLSFHSTPLGVRGMRTFQMHLERFAGINRLTLKDAALNDEAACILATCLSHLPQLDAIDLRDNMVGTDGIFALVTHLTQTTVLEVDLTGNKPLTRDGASAILRSKWAHSKLQKLMLPPIMRGALPCMLPLLISPGLQGLKLVCDCEESGHAHHWRRQSRWHLLNWRAHPPAPSSPLNVKLVARNQRPVRGINVSDHNVSYSNTNCAIQ